MLGDKLSKLWIRNKVPVLITRLRGQKCSYNQAIGLEEFQLVVLAIFQDSRKGIKKKLWMESS